MDSFVHSAGWRAANMRKISVAALLISAVGVSRSQCSFVNLLTKRSFVRPIWPKSLSIMLNFTESVFPMVPSTPKFPKAVCTVTLSPHLSSTVVEGSYSLTLFHWSLSMVMLVDFALPLSGDFAPFSVVGSFATLFKELKAVPVAANLAKLAPRSPRSSRVACKMPRSSSAVRRSPKLVQLRRLFWSCDTRTVPDPRSESRSTACSPPRSLWSRRNTAISWFKALVASAIWLSWSCWT
mmetsp:Transcript_15187/g.31794  ORF Transcript_15187/g.31794 Transcript_15187/m.31794 type:complete len:238 (+) Transcript_15187:1194-1907(+)